MGVLAGIVLGLLGRAHAQPVDAHWDPQFGANGLNDYAYAMVPAADGSVYVGGEFTEAGGTPANGVARWDGAAWHALGDGVDGEVHALAFGPDGTLYVGGNFDTAGGKPASHVAMWDGQEWHALGAGLNDFVLALAVASDGTVYAGGLFFQSGGESVRYLARWDGATWSELGEGIDSPAEVLEFGPDGLLYVGGGFSQAGGEPAIAIARWNGSSWEALGDLPVSSYVRAIAFDAEGLPYVGGAALTSGLPEELAHVVRWDPVAEGWVAVGERIDAGGDDCLFIVTDLTFKDDVLYAGSGEFRCFPPAVPDFTLSIAEWDGVSWHPLGSGVNGLAADLARVDNDLYVAGLFTEAGGRPSLNFARWNDTLILGTHSRPPDSLVNSYALEPAYPNPFNPETVIPLTLPEAGRVTVAVYDVLGRRVAVLADGPYAAGRHTLRLDGRRLASGAYLVRAVMEPEAGVAVRAFTQRITLLK